MSPELIAIFVFGVSFIATLLVIALRFPDPTPFQYTVFRIVLALSAAGIAALIPGLLQVSMGEWLKGSGALAVFAVVYFYSPAGLAGDISKRKKISSVELVDARLDSKDSAYQEQTRQGRHIIKPKSGPKP
jgi:hypothetical protein